MRKSSSEGSEGFADYDDQSGDGSSSENEDKQSSEGLMAGSEDSDQELAVPGLMRMTSM